MTILSYLSQSQSSLTNAHGANEIGAITAAGRATSYSLTMVNRSGGNWTFYVYQKLPQPQPNIFSLAWFASPFVIVDGSLIKFEWEINYNFVWSATGSVRPGVQFEASGVEDCDPNGNNTTEFSVNPGPHLTTPVRGQPSGSLVIKDAPIVPNQTYSVGIGMSGQGTYVVQAGANLSHIFSPTPTYWIAAGQNVKVGQVLNIDTITQTAEVKFPVNEFRKVATLHEDNTWSLI